MDDFVEGSQLRRDRLYWKEKLPIKYTKYKNLTHILHRERSWQFCCAFNMTCKEHNLFANCWCSNRLHRVLQRCRIRGLSYENWEDMINTGKICKQTEHQSSLTTKQLKNHFTKTIRRKYFALILVMFCSCPFKMNLAEEVRCRQPRNASI